MIRLLLALLLFPLAAACATTTPEPAARRIALTFDDVPRERGAFLGHDERTVRLIAALHGAGVRQAAFFVNPGFLAEADRPGGEARIAAYVAAGHVLANHSFSHPRLAATSAEAYLADIDRAEEWLRGREGRRPWFRFPYLDEGMRDHDRRDAVRAGLAARGLRNGYVTIDGTDWNLEALTRQAARDGRAMDLAALRDLYVRIHVDAAEDGEALARRELGRSPAHVLLLHETDLAALFVGDLVAALRERGWTIVTADEAYADPLGREMPGAASANGTLLRQIANARGQERPALAPGTDPETQRRLFTERVLQPPGD